MVGGDFNVILTEEEKKGGLDFTQFEALDFSQCVNNCALTELKFVGSDFTWWNGRIEGDSIFKRNRNRIMHRFMLYSILRRK
ncbi:hypothetical protein R3W88_026470 [Solanum pinnatisectum]|uniref:Reverse transcriptase n=1 Tax=Solanum pinnatisectum TaxID=50273 RepID=A0AAV9LDL2_9SOLN|nr:hypothetical protein R3W88_026470 [Solanum pinnatisectum]